MIVVDASACWSFSCRPHLAHASRPVSFATRTSFMRRTSWTSRWFKASDASCGPVKSLPAAPRKRLRISSTSISIGMPISISWVARGGCETTSARTTPCTSPSPRRLRRRSSPATVRWPRRPDTALDRSRHLWPRRPHLLLHFGLGWVRCGATPSGDDWRRASSGRRPTVRRSTAPCRPSAGCRSRADRDDGWRRRRTSTGSR